MAMASDLENVLRMAKLNGSNYRTWAFNMRLYLERFDLFGHADGSAVTPAETAFEATKNALVQNGCEKGMDIYLFGC